MRELRRRKLRGVDPDGLDSNSWKYLLTVRCQWIVDDADKEGRTICAESEDEDRDGELDHSEGDPEDLAAGVHRVGAMLTLSVVL